MNTLQSCSAIAGGLLAMLTIHSTPLQRARHSDDQVTPGETRMEWFTAEDDTDRYRARSIQEIEAFALTLDGMKTRCGQGELASRAYLLTRIEALREHVDYARGEVMKLPLSQGDENFTPALAHFHRTLTNLQEAFAQVADELADGA